MPNNLKTGVEQEAKKVYQRMHDECPCPGQPSCGHPCDAHAIKTLAQALTCAKQSGREEMRKYCKHLPNCDFIKEREYCFKENCDCQKDKYACTCGLDAALTTDKEPSK